MVSNPSSDPMSSSSATSPFLSRPNRECCCPTTMDRTRNRLAPNLDRELLGGSARQVWSEGHDDHLIDACSPGVLDSLVDRHELVGCPRAVDNRERVRVEGHW